MHRLGMAVSDDTLLRSLKHRAAMLKAHETLRVVGIDDWAWKKNHNYGTIIVDLERRKTVDLLAGRSAEEVAEWLNRHPGIETVSRDRNGLYANGATTGAPEAIQVADRFHLISNFCYVAGQELTRQRRLLVIPHSGSHQGPSTVPPPTESASQPVPPDSSTRVETRSLDAPAVLDNVRFSEVVEHRKQASIERRAVKLELFEKVRNLYAAGKQASQIMRETGLKRRRVDKWIRHTELPERNRMEPRINSPAYFQEYLAQRWKQGVQHGRTLLKEIRAQGYTGCFSGLARFLSAWRQPRTKKTRARKGIRSKHQAVKPSANVQMPASPEPIPSSTQVSPLVAAALLIKPGPQLTSRQQEKVDALKLACPDFARMRSLALSFRGILMNGKPESMDQWIADAAATGIHAMKRFARTLKQDIEAVKQAVSEKWSNGPVEGHVNRLKTLKRQMYGRAGFELLRARVLPIANLSP